MTEDRLRKDYDEVENLGDLITAREERESAFSDDVDAMDDIDTEGLPRDASDELTFPHPKGQAEESGAEGVNVNLMSTSDEKETEFDWQDSVEEMLPTDPEPNEDMGEDNAIEALAHFETTDLAGPVPSTEFGSETDTAATESEKEEYDIDGGEPCPQTPVELETSMDTDSDEFDFSIEEKFKGEVNHETAEFEFEQMRREIESQEQHKE